MHQDANEILLNRLLSFAAKAVLSREWTDFGGAETAKQTCLRPVSIELAPQFDEYNQQLVRRSGCGLVSTALGRPVEKSRPFRLAPSPQ